MTSSASAIRPVGTADRDAVLATVRAADLLPADGVAEVVVELDAFLDGRPDAGAWLVDVTGTDVAGVAYYVPEQMTDGTWNLLMLAVHPDRQGRGRGSALVRAVEQDLRSRSARLLVIDTSGVAGFAAQRRFYEHLGYRQQGWIDDFYEPGDAKVVYAKSLNAERVADTDATGVRVANPDDLEPLTKLAVSFYAEDGFNSAPDQIGGNLRSLVTSHHARVTLATEPATDTPAAFAVTTTSFGLENGLIAELEDLYVTPHLRRGGLGTALVEDAAAWARGRGCQQLEVVIAPNGRDVAHLHRYYAALGFAEEGRTLRSRTLSSAR